MNIIKKDVLIIAMFLFLNIVTSCDSLPTNHCKFDHNLCLYVLASVLAAFCIFLYIKMRDPIKKKDSTPERAETKRQPKKQTDTKNYEPPKEPKQDNRNQYDNKSVNKALQQSDPTISCSKEEEKDEITESDKREYTPSEVTLYASVINLETLEFYEVTDTPNRKTKFKLISKVGSDEAEIKVYTDGDGGFDVNFYTNVCTILSQDGDQRIVQVKPGRAQRKSNSKWEVLENAIIKFE